jgi:hypothetical protein
MVVTALSVWFRPGPPRWWRPDPFSSVLSCWFIWWCFFLLWWCGRNLLGETERPRIPDIGFRGLGRECLLADA